MMPAPKLYLISILQDFSRPAWSMVRCTRSFDCSLFEEDLPDPVEMLYFHQLYNHVGYCGFFFFLGPKHLQIPTVAAQVMRSEYVVMGSGRAQSCSFGFSVLGQSFSSGPNRKPHVVQPSGSGSPSSPPSSMPLALKGLFRLSLDLALAQHVPIAAFYQQNTVYSY